MTGHRKTFQVVRQHEGSWTYHPQPPLPATTAFVTGGWREVTRLCEDLDAVEHFPSSGHYDAFVREFGPPPKGTPAEQALDV